jgi:hypothetical protein
MIYHFYADAIACRFPHQSRDFQPDRIATLAPVIPAKAGIPLTWREIPAVLGMMGAVAEAT